MPWQPTDALKHKKGLTKHAQEVWANVANSALESCLNKGGTQRGCEASAIKQANSVAK